MFEMRIDDGLKAEFEFPPKTKAFWLCWHLFNGTYPTTKKTAGRKRDTSYEQRRKSCTGILIANLDDFRATPK